METNLLQKILTFSCLLIVFLSTMIGCESNTSKKSNAKIEETKDLILATTTSTQDSGLLDVLIPMFEKEYSIHVKTIAVGSGQALEMGTKGEADVLLVHAPSSEEKLVRSGDVINRQRVMYNDFILVGPSDDPARLSGKTITESFYSLANWNGIFVSRGDDSGTHKKELTIWDSIGGHPASMESYIETGQGMGATLHIAAEKGGYVLTDRATFLAQQKNFPHLSIIIEGDKDLLNIYHVMQVNKEKHEKVYTFGAKAFVDFMVSDDTQKVISEFGKEEFGQSLFTSYTE
jgi:tungstate transport system substrate-binding protein